MTGGVERFPWGSPRSGRSAVRIQERHGWIRMHRPLLSGFGWNQIEVNRAYGVPTENP